jgi:integrase
MGSGVFEPSLTERLAAPMKQVLANRNGQAPPSSASTPGAWSRRYGDRHRFTRITDFPASISPPRKVRIYQRQDHYVLQWWDPRAKGNLSDRVDGDLLDALARARQIDQRLIDSRASGETRKKITHAEFVTTFLGDLQRRANAREIAEATVRRYKAALDHYLCFVAQDSVVRKYALPAAADRSFALDFSAFLNTQMISPNGHPNTAMRRMQRCDYVLDVVRAIFEWAANPDRGHLLPSTFRNPFLKSGIQRRRTALDHSGEPDITISMAAKFLIECDEFQKRLFAPMILYGLRAAEPSFLFREYVTKDSITIKCINELDYTTKGVRDKRLPLVPALRDLLNILSDQSRAGLLFVRREVANGTTKSKLLGSPLQKLVEQYEFRCARHRPVGINARIALRDAVLCEAGALNYDLIQGEFRRVATTLDWPRQATLKDFRHLFATSMANAGLPDHERRYLMGHAPGRSAISVYTHFNKLDEHFQKAVEQEMRPILDVMSDAT